MQSRNHPPRGLRRSILSFLVLSALFAIAYSQSPLYTSNQNQYFLHGLAAGGYGNLSQDWLANTIDPTPVFSKLVELTYCLLRQTSVFYVYYALLMGIYFYSLIGIADHLLDLHTSRLKSLAFIALLVIVHSAGLRFALSRWLGANWTYVLEDGVADQRMLGPVFQPSAFGVLLALSVYLYLLRKPYWAILAAIVATIFHPTYLLSAAMLTLTYMLIDLTPTASLFPPSRYGHGLPYHDLSNGQTGGQAGKGAEGLRPQGADKRGIGPSLPLFDQDFAWRLIRQPIQYGLFALLLVSPVVFSVYTSFFGASPETTARAQEILISYRIPHHALVSQWFDATVLVKMALVALAIVLAFRLGRTKTDQGAGQSARRLGWVLLGTSLMAITGTLVQIMTRSTSLALLFPWRISVLVVPVSTALLLAFLVERIVRWLERRAPHLEHAVSLLSLVALFLAVLVGGIRFMLDVQRKAFAPERQIESFVYAHKTPGDLYLTPVKLQDFRLESGAPAFVDFKSIPYKDTDVLEWYRRVRLADRFYAKGDCALLETLVRDEGITHIVLEAEHQQPNCSGFEVIYQDAQYLLWETTPASTQAPVDAAQQMLDAYFSALSAGRFADAAALYGGDYQVLADNNPDLSPSDHAALFQNACQINGFVCNLAVRKYISESQPSPAEFVFVVEFQTAEGKLFTLGPCCGADPTESPPVTQFEYHVQAANGKYRAMDLPVYQP